MMFVVLTQQDDQCKNTYVAYFKTVAEKFSGVLRSIMNTISTDTDCQDLDSE
jgi:hypothetical protein